MIQKNLMGSHFSGEQAKSLVGRKSDNLSATGSTSQANSLAIFSELNVVTTTGANTGVRLPSTLAAGDSMFIQNNGASTLFIYPPVGGILNGGSANAKVDCATLKGAWCVCLNGLDFAVQVGA